MENKVLKIIKISSAFALAILSKLIYFIKFSVKEHKTRDEEESFF